MIPFLLLLACVPVAPADDVKVVTLPGFEVVALPGFETGQLRREQLFQSVFSRSTREESLVAAEIRLQREIDFLRGLTPLSDGELSKLKLAGAGDIQRFFNEFEDCMPGLLRDPLAPVGLGDAGRRHFMLRSSYQTGLHQRGSVFQKVLRLLLTAEQFETYEQKLAERVRQRHQRLVSDTLTKYRAQLRLTDDQRERLFELLASEPGLPPGDRLESYDHRFVLYVLSKVPEESLRPFIQDQQWPNLNKLRQFGEGYADQFAADEGNLPAAVAAAILARQVEQVRLKQILEAAAALRRGEGVE